MQASGHTCVSSHVARLGLEKINVDYLPCLHALFEMPQSLGIIGAMRACKWYVFLYVRAHTHGMCVRVCACAALFEMPQSLGSRGAFVPRHVSLFAWRCVRSSLFTFAQVRTRWKVWEGREYVHFECKDAPLCSCACVLLSPSRPCSRSRLHSCYLIPLPLSPSSFSPTPTHTTRNVLTRERLERSSPCPRLYFCLRVCLPSSMSMPPSPGRLVRRPPTKLTLFRWEAR